MDGDGATGIPVYIMPGGWITSDLGYAQQAWRDHERMRDPGTAVIARCWVHPPAGLYNRMTGKTSTSGSTA